MTTLELTERDRFEAWLKELDEICFDELGLSFKDLADQPYKTWFEQGFSAEDAFYSLAENCFLGVEFENVRTPISGTYTQEFDTFSDADSGL
jgi:hypothetical protein